MFLPPFNFPFWKGGPFKMQVESFDWLCILFINATWHCQMSSPAPQPSQWCRKQQLVFSSGTLSHYTRPCDSSLQIIPNQDDFTSLSFCILKRRAFQNASWKFWLTLHSVHQCKLTTARCPVQLHSQVNDVESNNWFFLLVHCPIIPDPVIPPHK